MATQIIAVNKVSAPDSTGSGTHEHISKVKTAGGQVLTRAEVVSKIQSSAEEFVTVGPAGQEPKVIVVSCPSCSASDYIRTTDDDTTADNLLKLPSFTE